MAYACLTLMEGSTGLTGRQDARGAASLRYRIDRAVLKTLGELTSARGDREEARKFDAGATGAPLTQKEKGWIVEVVKALIRRKGEYDDDPTAPLAQITMADFVSLGGVMGSRWFATSAVPTLILSCGHPATRQVRRRRETSLTSSRQLPDPIGVIDVIDPARPLQQSVDLVGAGDASLHPRRTATNPLLFLMMRTKQLVV